MVLILTSSASLNYVSKKMELLFLHITALIISSIQMGEINLSKPKARDVHANDLEHVVSSILYV